MKQPSVKNSPKIPLRLVLIVPFVLQIFATVSLVGYLSFRNGQKVVNDLASQLMDKTNKLVAQHLDSYLALPHKINQVNSDAVETGTLNLQDKEKVGHFFLKQLQLYNVTVVGYGYATGELISAGRWLEETQGLTIAEISAKTNRKSFNYATDSRGKRTKVVSEFEYEPLKEQWYINTIKVGKAVWGPVNTWDGVVGYTTISANRPLFDENKNILGVLGVELRLSEINNFLEDLKVSPEARVFIIERDGLLIANSTPQKPFTIENKKTKRLSSLNSNDTLIKETNLWGFT
jgi:Cache domain